MTTLQWIDERPIRRKLEAELAAHAEELATLETTIGEYFSRDLPQYQSWINYHFADDLVQITLLEKKVLALGNHIEESIELSMKMKLHPTDLFAGWTEDQILDKVLSTEEECAKHEAPVEASSAPQVPACSEARELYRRIARCLHPDLRGQVGEIEKNLWVKAQAAYAKNDIFELQRIEQNIRCGDLKAEPITCGELLRQLQDFRTQQQDLKKELGCLKQERAWQFSQRKNMSHLEREVQSEFRNTLKELKSRENYLHKTLSSWVSDPTPSESTTKARKRNHKSQVSLF